MADFKKFATPMNKKGDQSFSMRYYVNLYHEGLQSSWPTKFKARKKVHVCIEKGEKLSTKTH